ncbi:hypothetical protein PIB30_029577 [Stylosanthes scabra]|uniref:Uncharacterized protein n=1 Tax=Stylosanthes scabra TaxID=79078 RepID=A0ABU6X918_9FABA|nr:hypothetical protein [Stylosanthes scabra]
MPHELYDTLDLGPLKKSKEVFSTAATSIMPVAGIADNVRPFLKIGGFKQDYYDDTFKFSAGKTTKRFQIIKKRKDHSLQKDDGRMRGKESARTEMIEALAKGWVKMLKEELEGSSCAEQKNQTKGPDKTHEKPLAEYPSTTRTLNKTEKILRHDKGADAHLMVRTRSASLAKGRAKLCQPPMRASPRLAALRSNTAVQIPTPTPDVPVKEVVRRSCRLAALYSVTKPVSEEKVVIKISDDSVQKEDTNLEQNEAEPVAEVGGRVDLPKNDVYDALWAMLDAKSDNEAAEMPREWDLDSTLLN